jgi:hypothetical protein
MKVALNLFYSCLQNQLPDFLAHALSAHELCAERWPAFYPANCEPGPLTVHLLCWCNDRTLGFYALGIKILPDLSA